MQCPCLVYERYCAHGGRWGRCGRVTYFRVRAKVSSPFLKVNAFLNTGPGKSSGFIKSSCSWYLVSLNVLWRRLKRTSWWWPSWCVYHPRASEMFSSTKDSKGRIYCKGRWYQKFKGDCCRLDNPTRCSLGSASVPERQDEQGLPSSCDWSTSLSCWSGLEWWWVSSLAFQWSLCLFEINLASGRGLLVANWLSTVINGLCCCMRTRSMIRRTLGTASSETIFWFGWVTTHTLFPVTFTSWMQAFKHIFTSPSSVEKEVKATRSGNARIHGMTRVTTASLAYVATQVRLMFDALSVHH